ncbi:membrane protein containing NADH:ubiquinone/plastoquinone oxidoreductase domain protein, partial [mine drainage metagenome]
MTHAFFKALLFLAAGSVIIAMHHEQDMRKMGGLGKYMPITAVTAGWVVWRWWRFHSSPAITRRMPSSRRW